MYCIKSLAYSYRISKSYIRQNKNNKSTMLMLQTKEKLLISKAECINIAYTYSKLINNHKH